MFWNHYDFIQGNGYYDIIQMCTHKQKYMNHRLSEKNNLFVILMCKLKLTTAPKSLQCQV